VPLVFYALFGALVFGCGCGIGIFCCYLPWRAMRLERSARQRRRAERRAARAREQAVRTGTAPALKTTTADVFSDLLEDAVRPPARLHLCVRHHHHRHYLAKLRLHSIRHRHHRPFFFPLSQNISFATPFALVSHFPAGS